MSQNVLLSGIVGSTAYGLATENSDIDRLGVFAVDTIELHGLRRPQESYVTMNPDVTMHEAAKYCRLALQGNPSVTELLWLPGELIEECTSLGEELISLRSSFLSAHQVRGAYLGYATQQLKKIKEDHRHLLNSLIEKKVRKHARHMYRLLLQGAELWTTGRLSVRLSDPDIVQSFGTQVALGDLSYAEYLLQKYEMVFDKAPTALPDHPDEQAVETWLRKVRAFYFRPTSH